MGSQDNTHTTGSAVPLGPYLPALPRFFCRCLPLLVSVAATPFLPHTEQLQARLPFCTPAPFGFIGWTITLDSYFIWFRRCAHALPDGIANNCRGCAAMPCRFLLRTASALVFVLVAYYRTPRLPPAGHCWFADCYALGKTQHHRFPHVVTRYHCLPPAFLLGFWVSLLPDTCGSLVPGYTIPCGTHCLHFPR